MYFASDNSAPTSNQIMAAILEANSAPMPSYGADPWSQGAEAKLNSVFERECRSFLVSTGTAANALSLSALCPPWGAVLCHKEAHINVHECGAPEFYTGGAKLVLLEGECGKITPETLQAAIAALPRSDVHVVQPAALSLSQATESGTIYTPAQIAALTEIAHASGLSVHMDGARFANALVHAKCTPAELTWKAGVDVLSFGATKNGALACEAVIFFDTQKADTFGYQRKRAGHLVSKGRLLGAQMSAYLNDDHWLHLAEHANAMAAKLSTGLGAVPGVRLAWPVEANEVFVVLPKSKIQHLRAKGAVFYEWSVESLPPSERPKPEESLIRLICSFMTAPEQVTAFLEAAKSA